MSQSLPSIPLTDWLAFQRVPARWQRYLSEYKAAEKQAVAELPAVVVTPPPAHVGLWLDRCLPPEQVKEKGRPARTALYLAAIDALRLDAGRPAVQHYRARFEWHREQARQSDDRHIRRVFEVEAQSRLLIGAQSNSTVTEGAVLLHHTYGVPYLPGSALKGICRDWLERSGEVIADDTPQHKLARLLFGHAEPSDDNQPDDPDAEPPAAAGYFDFHDALWIPEPPADAPRGYSPLALDAVTPHHGEYYTKAKDNRPFPHPTEAPVPTQRLTVAPKTRFLVVIEGINAGGGALESWMGFVIESLLLPALAEHGIGARTTAGFGRFIAVGPGAPRSALAARSSRPAGTKSSAGTARRAEPREAPSPATPARQFAQVRYHRGRQALTAHLSDGRQAELNGSPATTLLATLSANIASPLREGKTVRLLVGCEPLGRRWRITDLSEG